MWASKASSQPFVANAHISCSLEICLADALSERVFAVAVDFVATALAREPNRPWSIGPLGHALHALVIYEQRVFGAAPPEPADTLADTEQ